MNVKEGTIRVRDTEIVPTDTSRQYREKLARIALDEMYQFVAVLNAHGTLLEVNRAALEGAGLRLSDVEGKPFWKCFWWAVSIEIQETLKDAVARAAQGEFVRYDVEIYGKARGKETIVIDFSMIPVKDETGKVVFIVPEGRDITEKKAYEREIAQKNADLQALLTRISELDEIKTQFFANVSHELRTPLALIIGPAERIMNMGRAMNSEEQRETANVIARNAKMLLKHVNDLLDISKLEAGKLKIELNDTNVATLVRFIASHFDVLAVERQVEFRVETPHSSLIAVDPEKLQRVVMNLLSNAFKYVPVGGTVRCSLETKRNETILTIEDSGPGVKPELRTAIFERFRQGDGGTAREFGGTGLGLAIAHEFVEMHKGTIRVLESPLGGALFQVTLPEKRLSASSAELAPMETSLDRGTLEGLIEELRLPGPSQLPAELTHPHTSTKALVLVVEDNPEMNRFIVQCLSHDYDVITAFDGQQGLEKALAFNPTLIISDIMMPRFSGAQLVTELRKRPQTSGIPILLLSAKADADLKARLLEEGAQDFVTKPFTERELVARAQNMIAGKQLYDAEGVARRLLEATNRELWARNEHLSQLFQKTPSFMAVLRGPNHVFELANAAYHKLVGQRQLIGKPLAEALPEVKGQGFIDLLDRVLGTGEPYVGGGALILLQRELGAAMEERYIDFVYQPLLMVDGSVSGVFVEGNDVTDHKRAESALREADRRKDEFLATLAHELRNPLAPILHATRISKLTNTTDAQMKWAHEVIERQVNHMARLLDDLLDVSRITRGRLELRKERLGLQDSLVAALETVRPLIEARGHELKIEISTVEALIDADPVRFAQILTNLLVNAAKYTDQGGVIQVSATLEEGCAVISVRDNGIGVSAELLPGLFEMFSQVTSPLDRSEGGLGIGLSLVRGLVLLHGGRIEARSPGIGKGSEFIVRLPLAGGSQFHPASTTTTDDASIKSKGLRVVVADDNRDNADCCSMLLEMAGHEVRIAYTGTEALRIAGEFGPRVMLLDIGMPEMNGHEVARRVRATEWGKSIVLVAVTGWGKSEDKREAEAAGFDHHFLKPVDFEVLRDLVARIRDG